MFALGIDTSNYATSMAVVNISSQEVVCARKKFLSVKSGELGLRQSDAVFQHTVALPLLLEEIEEALLSLGILLREITAVGVSEKPRQQEGSYMPCFLAGLAFASAFAAGAGANILKTTHQDGHIWAALHDVYRLSKPNGFLFFHLSGGTTELLYLQENMPPLPIGGTLDLYAGQAVDRLGVKLGLSFPAGVGVSALAAKCEVEMDPKVSVKGSYFNLSGLQNQCDKLLEAGHSPEYVSKYCLVFISKSVSKVLKNLNQEYLGLPIICAGGVSSSQLLRDQLCKEFPNIRFASAELSADNAVGVALFAAQEV